jgi:DNA-binding transcriptional LysR family regulator
MEWSDVRIFLAVLRSGTLGGAARAVQRTTDGLILTEEGSAIVALAEQIEEGALAVERRLAGQEQNLRGSLRISSADWFSAYVLPPIIAAAAPRGRSAPSPWRKCRL